MMASTVKQILKEETPIILSTISETTTATALSTSATTESLASSRLSKNLIGEVPTVIRGSVAEGGGVIQSAEKRGLQELVGGKPIGNVTVEPKSTVLSEHLEITRSSIAPNTSLNSSSSTSTSLTQRVDSVITDSRLAGSEVMQALRESAGNGIQEGIEEQLEESVKWGKASGGLDVMAP